LTDNESVLQCLHNQKIGDKVMSNPLKELADMMESNPNLLDEVFADVDNEISLKKFHIKETRKLMKDMPDMIPQLQKIIDDYQTEIAELLKETA